MIAVATGSREQGRQKRGEIEKKKKGKIKKSEREEIIEIRISPLNWSDLS